jgi:hypothetical protein
MGISDFDAPSFLEVIAYLHGVADGIRAGRRGAGSLTTCAQPATRACAPAALRASDGRHMCDQDEPLPITRRTVPYLPQGVDTAWPNFVPAALPRARGIDGTAEDSAAPARRIHRTIPYLSAAVSIDPGATSAFPVDERISGVCLRVAPPSAEWFALTGTNDEGYGNSRDR